MFYISLFCEDGLIGCSGCCWFQRVIILHLLCLGVSLGRPAKGRCKLHSVDLTMQLIDHMAEGIVSITPPSGAAALDRALSGTAGAWIALFIYDSILFGHIMAKTWKTRLSTRFPLIGTVFRDGEPRLVQGWPFDSYDSYLIPGIVYYA